MKKLIVAAVCCILLAGCKSPGTDSGNRIDDLWEAKTEYIGNNSAVGKLVYMTEFSQKGSFSMELETAQEPYGLIINFDDKAEDLKNTDFDSDAVILLGLIENLDYVELKSGEEKRRIDASEVSEKLGYDVKALGESKEKLSEYLNQK